MNMKIVLDEKIMQLHLFSSFPYSKNINMIFPTYCHLSWLQNLYLLKMISMKKESRQTAIKHYKQIYKRYFNM